MYISTINFVSLHW